MAKNKTLLSRREKRKISKETFDVHDFLAELHTRGAP